MHFLLNDRDFSFGNLHNLWLFKWFRSGGVDESSWTPDRRDDERIRGLGLTTSKMAFEVFGKIKGVSFRYHLRKYAHGLEVQGMVWKRLAGNG